MKKIGKRYNLESLIQEYKSFAKFQERILLSFTVFSITSPIFMSIIDNQDIRLFVLAIWLILILMYGGVTEYKEKLFKEFCFKVCRTRENILVTYHVKLCTNENLYPKKINGIYFQRSNRVTYQMYVSYDEFGENEIPEDLVEAAQMYGSKKIAKIEVKDWKELSNYIYF